MLKFSSVDKAIQYLSDISNSRIIISSKTKVVDKSGKPLIMFQGRSKKGLKSLFNNSEGWFSAHRGVAVQFADMHKHLELQDTPEKYNTIKNEELRGEVYPVTLDIENPLYVDIKETLWNRDKEREKIKEAKNQGKDGLIITENGDIRDAVVFKEKQINIINPKAANINKVIISAPVLSKLLPKLSEKHNIGEDKILELASADPTYKGNPDTNQSKNISNIVQFYLNDKNLDLEDVKSKIKEFQKQKGSGKIKQDVKLPDSLDKLEDILEGKEELVLHSGDKFEGLNKIDTDGQYRLFKVDENWDEDNVFKKYESKHPWCVKEEKHYERYKPLFLFTKGNDFYALLSPGREFKNNKNETITIEEVKLIKGLIEKNNLIDKIKNTDAWSDIKFELLSKEELLKDTDYLNKAIKEKNKEKIKESLNAGAKFDEYSLKEAIDTNNKEVVKLLLDAGVEFSPHHLNQTVSIKNKDMTNVLLDAGVKPNPNTLTLAIRVKNKDLVEKVISLGIKPDKNDLYYATDIKDKDIIKMLLDTGIKPNQLAFSRSIRTKDKEILKLMLDAGADVDEWDLKEAIITKDKEIIDMIKEAM